MTIFKLFVYLICNQWGLRLNICKMKARPLFSKLTLSVAIRIQNRQKVVEYINASGAEVITVKTFETNGYAESVIKFEADVYSAVAIADYVNTVEQEVIDSGNNSWNNYKINS